MKQCLSKKTALFCCDNSCTYPLPCTSVGVTQAIRTYLKIEIDKVNSKNVNKYNICKFISFEGVGALTLRPFKFVFDFTICYNNNNNNNNVNIATM